MKVELLNPVLGEMTTATIYLWTPGKNSNIPANETTYRNWSAITTELT